MRFRTFGIWATSAALAAFSTFASTDHTLAQGGGGGGGGAAGGGGGAAGGGGVGGGSTEGGNAGNVGGLGGTGGDVNPRTGTLPGGIGRGAAGGTGLGGPRVGPRGRGMGDQGTQSPAGRGVNSVRGGGMGNAGTQSGNRNGSGTRRNFGENSSRSSRSDRSGNTLERESQRFNGGEDDFAESNEQGQGGQRSASRRAGADRPSNPARENPRDVRARRNQVARDVARINQQPSGSGRTSSRSDRTGDTRSTASSDDGRYERGDMVIDDFGRDYGDDGVISRESDVESRDVDEAGFSARAGGDAEFNSDGRFSRGEMVIDDFGQDYGDDGVISRESDVQSREDGDTRFSARAQGDARFGSGRRFSRGEMVIDDFNQDYGDDGVISRESDVQSRETGNATSARNRARTTGLRRAAERSSPNSRLNRGDMVIDDFGRDYDGDGDVISREPDEEVRQDRYGRGANQSTRLRAGARR